MSGGSGFDKARQADVERLQNKAIATATSRFGEDEVGTERIRRIEDPDLLADLLFHLGTAASLADALTDLPSAC